MPRADVLDRGDATRSAFGYLKVATLKSIESLGPGRKFQIVFWNNGSDMAYPAKGMADATPANIEAARKANRNTQLRHEVSHAEMISPEDLPRFKALNAAVEFSPYLWDPQPINDDITSAVGPPRIDRVWPIKEGFASGALVIAGSDWAVVPTPNPWIGIETAIGTVIVIATVAAAAAVGEAVAVGADDADRGRPAWAGATRVPAAA